MTLKCFFFFFFLVREDTIKLTYRKTEMVCEVRSEGGINACLTGRGQSVG